MDIIRRQPSSMPLGTSAAIGHLVFAQRDRANALSPFGGVYASGQRSHVATSAFDAACLSSSMHASPNAVEPPRDRLSYYCVLAAGALSFYLQGKLHLRYSLGLYVGTAFFFISASTANSGNGVLGHQMGCTGGFIIGVGAFSKLVFDTVEAGGFYSSLWRRAHVSDPDTATKSSGTSGSRRIKTATSHHYGVAPPTPVQPHRVRPSTDSRLGTARTVTASLFHVMRSKLTYLALGGFLCAGYHQRRLNWWTQFSPTIIASKGTADSALGIDIFNGLYSKTINSALLFIKNH